MLFRFFLFPSFTMDQSTYAKLHGMELQTFLSSINEETTSFLKNKLKDVQRIQSRAIAMALDGVPEKLAEIRNSRNVMPAIPEAVCTKDVSPGMKLFMSSKLSQQADCDDTSQPLLPLLVYFHGGGWTFGSINSCSRYCASVAESGKVLVLAVDYRLAPEHPYPAALDDCSRAFRFSLEHALVWGADPNRVSLGGDSSGGNLALAVALNAVCEKTTLPSSLVLFYPVVKAAPDGSLSWREYGEGYGLDASIMELFYKAYLGTADQSRNPLVSVADAPEEWLRQLPPILFVAAEKDVLHDQGYDMVNHLRNLGVPVEYNCLDGATHLFITVDGQPTAFRYAVEATIDFLS